MTNNTLLKDIKQFVKSSPKEFCDFGDICYLTLSGSRAYKTSNKDSDYDIRGIFVPSLRQIFPFDDPKLNIFGFDSPTQLKTIQETHLNLDLQIHSIAHYLALCAKASPNVIESLFVDKANVIYTTDVGDYLRRNRKMFLTKDLAKTFLAMGDSHFDKAMNIEDKVKEEDKFRKLVCTQTRCYDNAWQIVSSGELKLNHISELLQYTRYKAKVSDLLKCMSLIDEEKRVILRHMEVNQRELADCVDKNKVRAVLLKAIHVAHNQM